MVGPETTSEAVLPDEGYFPYSPAPPDDGALLVATAAALDTEADLPGVLLGDRTGDLVGLARPEKRDANRATFPPEPPPSPSPADFDGVDTEATLAGRPPAAGGAEDRTAPFDDETALARPYRPTPGGYTALSDPATEPPAVPVDGFHPPGDDADADEDAAGDAPPKRLFER
jgi:hypothetical protein